MLKTMNALDALLLLMESPETPMHIAGVQILKMPRSAGPDFVAKVHREMLGHAAAHPPFNYRLGPKVAGVGLPAWEVLDRVDLDEHVFRHALPWPAGQRELMALVSRLNAGPMDRSRPLWELHLIEGLPDGCYAVFTRIHHALMDGQWGMKLAHETTSADPRRRGLPPYWAVRYDEAVVEAKAREVEDTLLGGRLRRSLAKLEGAKSVAELRKAFRRTYEAFRHPADDGLVRPYTAPESMLNGKLTPRRELAVTQLDLALIKELAHAHGATVNEVVLAVCGGALRHYLLEHDALPDKPIIANMPIAIHRSEGAEGGNSIISGMVSLATHIADPVQRFETVRGSSQHAKELVREMATPVALTVYMGVTGIPFLLAQLTGNVERVHPQNLIVSNVPGPKEKRYVNGCEIVAEYPISLLVPGQALNITVVSHAQWLDVAVLVCPSLVPQPQRLADAAKAALDELAQALKRPATRRRSAPRARRPS